MTFATALGLVAGPLALGATILLVNAVGLAALAWALMALTELAGRGLRELEAPASKPSTT